MAGALNGTGPAIPGQPGSPFLIHSSSPLPGLGQLPAGTRATVRATTVTRRSAAVSGVTVGCGRLLRDTVRAGTGRTGRKDEPMTKLLLDDDLLDAQLIRAIGATSHQGADLGEVVQAMRGLDEKSLDSWYAAWNALGERVFALAEEQERAGHRISARKAFLRACTYL